MGTIASLGNVYLAMGLEKLEPTLLNALVANLRCFIMKPQNFVVCEQMGNIMMQQFGDDEVERKVDN